MYTKISSDKQTNYEYLRQLALEDGFTTAASLNMDALIFRREVRDMCNSNKCNNYDKSWSCPPAVASLDVISKKAMEYSSGILVQTTASLCDDFDVDGINQLSKKHQASFDAFVRQAKILLADVLPMGSGGCRRCMKCTYPNKPCRYPKKLYPSMESYGLWVSDICEKSDVKYYYGPKTMTFTACILYNQ